MSKETQTNTSGYTPGPGKRPGGFFGRGPMGGMIPGEKPKDFKGTLKKTFIFLKPHKFKLTIIMCMAVLSTVFSIAGPKILGGATTSIAGSLMTGVPIDFREIGNIIITLIILYLISALFGYLQQYIMAGVAQKTVFDMRLAVEQKLSVLPLKFYDSKTHGEILSRVTNDIDTVSFTLQQSLTQMMTSLVTLIGILFMMVSISGILTLIALITVPLSMIFTIFVTKKSQKFFRNQQRYLGELNGHIEEMYGGHTVIKAFAREEQVIDQFADINGKLYENGWKAQFISGMMMPILSFIGNIGYVLICVIGGIFVIQGKVNIGSIQAFLQYSRQFTHPIVQTAQIANILQSTVAAAERVFEVLEEPEEVPDYTIDARTDYRVEPLHSGVSIKGIVEFCNVRFGYSADKILIRDLSFKTEKGQTVAIVGPTGAGKTTLVNLIMRFYDIESGDILVNGVSIRELPRSILRRNFGMVLQDTWLFGGSIRDNIAYGCDFTTDENIIRAATLARADHFITTLAQGYDTIINEEASNISSGQKQLIAIARAILADPGMLILDEATSSVDTRTEILIQKGMKELMKGRTSFVIAHRLSTIIDADFILVMNQGDIVETGSHQELMKANGFYAELYKSQFTDAFAP
jgi:ATP-binding cassette, subfamily B, multidrug efflux pump